MFQWHPFSMSSAPFEADCMLHIRVLGNWTKSLYVGALWGGGWRWRWRIVKVTCALNARTHRVTCALNARTHPGRYDMIAKNGGPMKVKAYIEGPYGEPSVNVEDLTYQNFLLISGGIGITPVQSIANELLEQFSRGRPINKVRGVL